MPLPPSCNVWLCPHPHKVWASVGSAMTAPQNSPTPRRPVNVVFIRTKIWSLFLPLKKTPILGLYHIAKPCHKNNYKNIKDHNNDRGSNLTSTQVLWVSELYFWPDTSPTLQLDHQAGAQGSAVTQPWMKIGALSFITRIISSLVLPSQLNVWHLQVPAIIDVKPKAGWSTVHWWLLHEGNGTFLTNNSDLFKWKSPDLFPWFGARLNKKVLPSLKAKRPVVTACSTFVPITSLTAQDF